LRIHRNLDKLNLRSVGSRASLPYWEELREEIGVLKLPIKVTTNTA
jgi:hypothetical protein